MSKKTEVIRLTAEEARLIDVLRSHGMPKALECLDTAINSVPVESSDFLRSARSALKPNLFLSLEQLVEQGVMTVGDMEFLVLALQQNKNIAIVGSEGSGKTTLLKALLGVVDDGHRVCVLESHDDMDIKTIAPDKNIFIMKSGALTAKDILGKVLHVSLDRVVLGEVLSCEDATAIALAVMCGHAVMFSASAKEDSSVHDALEGLCGEGSSRIIESIKFTEFVEVRCNLGSDGKRTVKVKK